MYPARPLATALAALAVLSISACASTSEQSADQKPDSAMAAEQHAAPATGQRSSAPYKEHKADSTRMSGEGFYAHVLLRVARNAEKYGNYEAARSFYRRARAFSPYDRDVLLGLARSLEKNGEPMEASEAYGAVLAEQDNNEEAVAGLARTLEQIAAKSAENAPQASMKKNGSPMASNPAPKEDAVAMADAPAPKDDGAAMADAPAPKGDASAPMQNMAGDSDSGAKTREFAAATPPKADGKTDGKASATKLEHDVLKAVEWKDDNSDQAKAGGEESSGVDVASASPSSAVPGATPPPMAADPMMPAPDGYRLQLAAFSKRASAETARSRLEPRVKDLLGDVALSVEKEDGKYRVRTSSLGDRQHAAGLCARLKTRSIGCFLVKPTGGAKPTARMMPKHAAPKKAAPKMASAAPAMAPPPPPAKHDDAPPPMTDPAPKAKASPAPLTSDKPLGWDDIKVDNSK